MTRRAGLFVQDILNAISEIEKFIDGMDYKAFLKDDKTQSAVVWKIQVIGEASKNIPKPLRDKHNDIPWKYLARIRDKIAHFYFGIDYEIVWDVITRSLPELKPKIERIIDGLD